MTESVPLYVSVVFLFTTLTAVWFLLRAAESAGKNSLPVRLLYFLLPLWMLLTGFLSTAGFYKHFEVFPPILVLFGVLPALIFIAAYFVFFRKTFVDKLDLKKLTIVHIVRIPVEIVLLWLAHSAVVPKLMTFEGWNFDIIAGITAPIVYAVAFRNGNVARPVLIVWNAIALLLLANIVMLAVLSFPSPMQQLAFDQPNVAVAHLPFIWLPTIVVPIMLFSHIASLYKLLRSEAAAN